MKINETEKRVLLSLHLQGCMGKCGNMTRKKRFALLQGLITRGLLNEQLEVTQKAHELLRN